MYEEIGRLAGSTVFDDETKRCGLKFDRIRNF